MTKQSKRRSGRPSRPPTCQAHPVRPPPPRWWKRVTKTFAGLGTVTKIIIGAGTLAGAITGILTLVSSLSPKPVPENIGRFISVQPLSQVPLSEYPQRSAVFKLQSAKGPRELGPLLAMAVVRQSSPSSLQNDATTTPTPSPSFTTSTPSPSATTSMPSPSAIVSTPTGTPSSTCTSSSTAMPPPTGTPSPSCTPSSTGTASPSAPGSSTGAPTGGIKSLPPLGMSPHDAVVYANNVAAIVQKSDPGISLNCGDSPCVAFMAEVCTDPTSGQIVTLSNCASAIFRGIKDFNGFRLDSGSQGSGGSGSQGSGGSGSQGSGGSTKRQPLGELVSVDLELAGLKGQPVFLSWAIFQKEGPSHLSGRWLSNFVAYRLEAKTNDDTGTLEMWVPLPKQKGPYFIRVTLTTGGANLASMNSNPFD